MAADNGVVLLVGAGDAIGAGVARRFAKGGYKVCIARRDAAKSAGSGTFAASYLRAAQAAAPIIASTLYERYYGLPLDRIVGLNDIQEPQGPRYGTPRSPGCSSSSR